MKKYELGCVTAEDRQVCFEQLCDMDENELRRLYENSAFYAKLKQLVERSERIAPSGGSRVDNLGAAIKAVRNVRGLTQKELGLRLGFPGNAADVRVAQYESNVRVPRPGMLQKLQEVLGCDFNVVSYVEYSIVED